MVLADGRLTVAEIIAEQDAAMAAMARRGLVVVTLAGHIVPAGMLDRVKPRPATSSTLMVSLRPGNRDGRPILRTVLSILLIAGATAISGGALGPAGLGWLGSGFARGALGSYLLSTAVLGGGSLLLNALAPSGATADSADFGNARQLGSAQLQANVLIPGDYLPAVLGRRRIWPRQVTKPIRLLEGRDEVAEVLYAMAGRNQLSEVRIGGVPAADVAGVEVQVVDFFSPAPLPSLVNRYGAERGLAREVKWFDMQTDVSGARIFDQDNPAAAIPRWEVTRFPAADEFRLRLFWPEGLNTTEDLTETVVQPVRLRMRTIGGEWVNLPEIFFKSNSTDQYRKDIIIRRGTQAALQPVSDASRTAYLAYARAPGQGQSIYLADGTPNGPVDGTIGREPILAITGGPTNWIGTSLLGGASVANGEQFYFLAPAGFENIDNIAIDGNGAIDVGSAGATEGVWYAATISGGDFVLNSIAQTLVVGSEFGPKTDPWTADAHFYSTTIPSTAPAVAQADQNVTFTDEGVVIWIDGGVIADEPVEIGFIAGGAMIASRFDEDNYAVDSYDFDQWQVHDLFGYTGHSSIAAWWAPRTMQTSKGKVLIVSALALRNASPVEGLSKLDCSFIAVRGRNVNVADVSVLAESVVYDRAADAWVASRNPALVAEDVARGRRGRAAVFAGTIDTGAFDDWRTHCDDEDLTCGLEASGMRWEDAMAMLAGAGMAGFATAGEFRPYLERDRSAETARIVFNPENSRGFSSSKSWPARPTDGARVTFSDEDNDYKDNETPLLVYLPGKDGVSSRGIEDIRYPAITVAAQAEARAAFDLAATQARALAYQWESDQAALSVRKGDLVHLCYDVLAEQDQTHGVNARAISQTATIVTVTRNGSSEITSLTLNRPVYAEPTEDDLFDLADLFDAANIFAVGDGYAALVATGEGVATFLLDVAAAGETVTLTLLTPTVNADVAAGQKATVGRSTRLARRLIVESISPAGEFFRLTGVPEAPELHQ